ncbi:aspartate aminotransferase family protein [Paenibacillus gorillae]|uniref:aspartate aminotransferase family protein n=1 Tax=Paenibacillus gorillae TaxID=1243662 RepID=UPI002351D43D|nr:aminotransferase class III-fold pyridoxal phosphate-dependent enzyme [Paenibacillus gorillae]
MIKLFFASSGSEANESAVKLARKHGALHLGGAYEIITLTNSFHGRTLAMMSATGKAQWDTLYEPKVPGFIHVPINDFDACFAAISHNTCAIMLELVQGEGGVNAVDPAYLQAIRKACDVYGIMLIVDEIQTGLGRTGKLFAFEHYDVQPDVLTLGKGIGGGYPLSAMLTKSKFDLFEQGDQGGTYAGAPLGMAIGLAVVKEIVRLGLAEQAAIVGSYAISKLQELARVYPLSNIRGKGLLLAFDVPESSAQSLVAQSMEEGLLINAPKPSTIRLMPPLIATKSDVDEMIRLLQQALARIGLAAS